MRIGMCAGCERLSSVAALGFDYLEAPLSQIAALTDASFKEVCMRVDDSPIDIEVFGAMLPDELKIVGPGVNARALHDYLDTAFARASRLGGRVVVFTSPRSRNCPVGTDVAQAWRQIGNFLRLIQSHALDYDLRIAIEPMRRSDTNMINHLSEALAVLSLLQLQNVGICADTYHMAMCSEPLASIEHCASHVLHVRTSNALGRQIPSPADRQDYQGLFNTLLRMRYTGSVSIKAALGDVDVQGAQGLMVLRQSLGKALNNRI